MATKKEVATKESDNMLATIMDAAPDAGMEDFGADDYAIPFIKIVQKSSPIIDTNEAARPGMFYNSVSGQLYKELILVPCAFKKEVIEWAPRESGEGIQGSHPWGTPLLEEQAIINSKGIPELPNGNLLVETRYHYVMVIAPETGECYPALISMASTQHKRSKRWASLMSAKKMEINGTRRTPPSFMFNYLATTVQESKDGNTWYSWDIVDHEKVDEDWLLREAWEFHKSVKEDLVRHASEDTPF